MSEYEPPINYGPPDANNQARVMTSEAEDITLLGFLIVIAKYKKLIFGLPFAAAVIAALYSMVLPNVYTASTKILPPQHSQSAAAGMLAQLGGIGGIAGSALGIKSQNDLYIGMLKSRTIADGVIERFDLNSAFGQKRQSSTRITLEGMTRITANKNGIILIDVEDKDPKRAALLANGYVDELYKLTNVLAVTEASQRRLFFERQLERAKDNLATAETAARHSLETGGLVQVEGQGRAMIEATARLRGQITVKEVQIGSMRAFATDRNPEFLAAQHELQSMKIELAKMEGAGGNRVRGAAAANNSRGIDNLSLLRDVKYYETIYDLLAKQYEIAKLDEAKDSAIIQVLDKAIEPDTKSGPRRSRIVLYTTLVMGLFGICAAFIREASVKARQNPLLAERLNLLRHYVRGK
jgi:tyrosine-protein kinase Etk/Wzc